MSTDTKKRIDPRRDTSIPWQDFVCPKCEAGINERCQADSGRNTDPHTVRLAVAQGKDPDTVTPRTPKKQKAAKREAAATPVVEGSDEPKPWIHPVTAVRPSPNRMAATRPVVKAGVTMPDYEELVNRINRAVSALDSLRTTTSDFSEHQRLMGKADGMRLALSYLKDVGPS